MLKQSLFFLSMTTALASSAALADPSLQIQIGGGGRDVNARVLQLEQAVVNLQAQVNSLTTEMQQLKGGAPQSVACVLTDSFDHTYIGHGPTPLEATFQAQQSCQQSGMAAQFCTTPSASVQCSSG